MGGGARGRAVRPRALLAADCGGGVGLGHLERMLALADSLTSDLEVSILVPRGDAPLERRVDRPGTSSYRRSGFTRPSASRRRPSVRRPSTWSFSTGTCSMSSCSAASVTVRS